MNFVFLASTFYFVNVIFLVLLFLCFCSDIFGDCPSADSDDSTEAPVRVDKERDLDAGASIHAGENRISFTSEL